MSPTLVPRGSLPALACVIGPAEPLLSDYTPMAYLLYGVLAVVTLVASLATWSATKSAKNPWLRLLLRLLPVTVLWSFAPLGHAGYWWPAPCGLVFGDPGEKLQALLSILATSAVFYAPCALVLALARRERGPDGG